MASLTCSSQGKPLIAYLHRDLEISSACRNDSQTEFSESFIRLFYSFSIDNCIMLNAYFGMTCFFRKMVIGTSCTELCVRFSRV